MGFSTGARGVHRVIGAESDTMLTLSPGGELPIFVCRVPGRMHEWQGPSDASSGIYVVAIASAVVSFMQS